MKGATGRSFVTDDAMGHQSIQTLPWGYVEKNTALKRWTEPMFKKAGQHLKRRDGSRRGGTYSFQLLCRKKARVVGFQNPGGSAQKKGASAGGHWGSKTDTFFGGGQAG